MNSIQFADGDAPLLYFIDKAGSTVQQILRLHMGPVNRAAAPAYRDFVDCVRRAVSAGFVEVHGEKLVPTKAAYEMIHAADEAKGWGDVDSMIEFYETLLAKQWPIRNPPCYELDEAEYRRAVRAAEPFK